MQVKRDISTATFLSLIFVGGLLSACTSSAGVSGKSIQPMHEFINISDIGCLKENRERLENEDEKINSHPVNMNGEYQIKCSDIRSLEDKALKGDSGAAIRLANFYLYLESNMTEGVYWLEIAAENGSKTGMAELAFYFDLGVGDAYKMRAEFWRKQAVSKN